MIVGLLVLLASAWAAQCTPQDTAIHTARGSTFERDFRAEGGLFVSRSEFVDAVVRVSGLSHGCAECFGNVYICGWNECKAPCITNGPRCSSCLLRRGCTAALDACTGWPSK